MMTQAIDFQENPDELRLASILMILVTISRTRSEETEKDFLLAVFVD